VSPPLRTRVREAAAAVNPVRLVILGVGLTLDRFELVNPKRVRRTTDLAWPRIVTGLARMSKNAVDVAMVGAAIGSSAIAGVGFAGPYWGLAFALGGGVAAGTIALVSQRFGAEAYDELGIAIRTSAALTVIITLPLAVGFYLLARPLIDVIGNDPTQIRMGADYLRMVAIGVPFAGLNLIGSRAFIGLDDSWTPMVLRSGGAVTNIVLNAVFIFGLNLGVVGAALGTVVSNALVAACFAVGLVRGGLPLVGAFPVTIDPLGPYLDRGTVSDVVEIGLPVVGRSVVWTVARFPMLAIVAAIGPAVAAAYVISRRIWGLMTTPGWGFGLASSSLVGQELGQGDEESAEEYGRDIVRFSVATYVVAALVVALFARPIVGLFVGGGAEPGTVEIATALVYAACVATVTQGVKAGAAGPLDASGDTKIPFYSQLLGMFGFAIPLAYLGLRYPSFGLMGLYLSLIAETTVPAFINYYRFSTGKWKKISRDFRPDAAD
jgi:putative MATE family efflux protein